MACKQASSVKDKVSSGQSQSVAQNLLSASICEVLWRRKILPDDCFEEMRFARQSMHKIKDSIIGDSAEKNPKAKKLFHWIRDDVCKAIKEKVLKKVVMSIHSSEKYEADNLLETYSFNFAYDGDEIRFEVGAERAGSSRKENINGNCAKEAAAGEDTKHIIRSPPDGKLKEDIQRSTQLTIRSMLSLLEQSHDLPEQHFLSVAMFYNDSSEAQSFQASADFLTVPEDGTDLEELHPGMASSVLPLVSTGYHEMAIRMKTREDEKEAEGKALSKYNQFEQIEAPKTLAESSYKSPKAKAHSKGKRGHPYQPAAKDEGDVPCR